MATLLEHADKIRSEFREAFADKVLTARESFEIAGACVEAVRCTLDKLADPEQFNQLVTEAEELYDEVVDASKFDIPGAPEFVEQWAVSIAKGFIRPALEKLLDAVNGGE